MAGTAGALASQYGGGTGGSNSSAVNTPVTTTQGGIASQTFNIGGNPNVRAFANPWIIGGVALVGVLWLLKRKR